MAKRIEQRLVEAVALVLASGASCSTPAAPTTPPPATPLARPTDSWSSTTPEPLRPPDPSLPGPVKARQLCAMRKEAPLGNRPPVPVGAFAGGPGPTETSTWDAERSVALCTIVRERQGTDVQVTYTPRCCPAPDPAQQTPCPGPVTETTEQTVLLVEQAEIGADGKVLGSTSRWYAPAPHRPPQPGCGRRVAGACALGAGDPEADLVQRILAEMAELEAISVPAFEQLARELEAHGAPRKLVLRARAAMRDEIRHAHVLAGLAASHGVTPRVIAVDHVPDRSLLAIALENVVEGCVREAYGALLASYQAERAPEELRPRFRAIARDERRHAALAEDVHAWIVERLAADERDEVEAARAAAEAELRTSIPALPRCDELGMPGTPTALALFDGYFSSAAA